MNGNYVNFCNSLINTDQQKKLNGFSNPYINIKILSCSTLYEKNCSINHVSSSNDIIPYDIIDMNNIISEEHNKNDDEYSYFNKIIGDESNGDFSQFSELTKLLENDHLQNQNDISFFDFNDVSFVKYIKCIKCYLYSLLSSMLLFLIYHLFSIK